MMSQIAQSNLKKGKISKNTRRHITEQRITSNIMTYNQPVALIDNTAMEVSCDYQTQVSQSKFQLSS
jgi:hypothetical protein